MHERVKDLLSKFDQIYNFCFSFFTWTCFVLETSKRSGIIIHKVAPVLETKFFSGIWIYIVKFAQLIYQIPVQSLQ